MQKSLLDELNQAPYHLILMDVHMPDMDGYESTRRIRRLTNEKLRTIPIIALTANAMVGDDQKCLDAGTDDYIIKPIDRKILAQKLEKWISKALNAA